jgi:hypothetical protein
MWGRSHLLSIALLLMPLPIYADTVYTYTGNNFDAFDYANTSYSPSDFISFFFDVAAPLAADFSGVITPISYTVSDGVETLNQATVPETFFGITTDASANIINWNILFLQLSTDRQLFSFWDPELVGEDGSLDGYGDGAYILNSPGIWTSSTTSPPAVPEPSTLLLLGSGILAATGMVRRRLSPNAKENR